MTDDNVEILGYTLKLTCGACPEQYDVFTESGREVGYLRLRHGEFTASYPSVSGEVIYRAWPKGDGVFEYGERDHFLTEAVKEIHLHETKRTSYECGTVDAVEEEMKVLCGEGKMTVYDADEVALRLFRAAHGL